MKEISQVLTINSWTHIFGSPSSFSLQHDFTNRLACMVGITTIEVSQSRLYTFRARSTLDRKERKSWKLEA